MPPKPPEGTLPDPVRNRCRCGHYPTAHMRVAPISPRPGGSYRLVADGPCAVCGDAGCRKFAPGL